MRKFLAFALCAILVISSMAVSASAEEAENVASGNSYRDEFISALMNEESLWDLNDFTHEMQFIDLNFDGKKEFLVDYDVNSYNKISYIYSFDNGSVREIGNDNSNIFVQTDNLKSYYNSTTDTYKMMGSYKKTNGAIGDIYYYNFELFYNADSQSLKTDVHSRYEKTRGLNGAEETTTYYSADNNVITEEEYNSINSAIVSGFSDIDLKFKKASVIEYRNLSTSDKKEKLEWLYGSDNVEPEPTPEPTPKPIPNTDDDKKDDNNNNDNNTKNTTNNTNNTNNINNTNNTVKSPSTNAKNNYVAALFAVILAGGAAAVLSGSKRKEDI